ncbi:MAG: isopentenyl-diphosphate Delta-isomerase [Parcubacteria group bacterium]
MPKEIILVNKKDWVTGAASKMEAHQKGKLHRAFSIFIFNRHGKLLLQQRAIGKYHSGGLWTNTCCGHPHPKEILISAAHRRLQEEMGFDCKLTEIFSFIYRAKLDNGMREYEFDHVLIGKFNGKPKINPTEAEDCKWVDREFLIMDLRKNPSRYTKWFLRCAAEVFSVIGN